MREALTTHCGGHNSLWSKPRGREGVKASSIFDIRAMFDKEDKSAKEQLAKTPATPVGKASGVNPSVRKEVGPAVAEDVEVQAVHPGSRVEDVEKGTQLTAVAIDRRVLQKSLQNLRGKRALLVAQRLCISMHRQMLMRSSG